MADLLFQLGKLMARFRWIVIAAWLALALVVGVAGALAGHSAADQLSLPGSESAKASVIAEKSVSSRPKYSALVVFSADSALTDGPLTRGVNEALTNLRVPANSLERSPDGRTAFVQVRVPNTAPATFKRVERAIAPARAAGVSASVGGELGLVNSNPATSNSERLGFIAVLIVLLVAFGSGVAAGVPIVTAALSLVVGLSALTLIGRVAPIPGSANALAGMIGLGVAVDYALFVLTRFRAELAKGRHAHDAVALSLAAAGQAVVFAGGAVVVAICGLALTGIGFIMALGLSAALVVAISVAAALTLLPATLAVLGPRVDAWRLPWARRLEQGGGSGPWRQWAQRITRRPVPFLLVSIGLLAALTVPLGGLRYGGTDASMLAPGTPARVAYEAMAAGFGPGVNAPVDVVVTHTSASAAQSLAARIADVPGVSAVQPPRISADGGSRYGQVAVITVLPQGGPQSPDTTALVRSLRTSVLPAQVPDTAGTAYVGGPTARSLDLADRMHQRLPLVVGAVIALTILLLTAAFRAVLVPVKAAAMNLLSIGAAYGVLTFVVQEGHGAKVIGLDGPTPIPSFVPVFMFAILFGLSMDYEVFLLSRMREAYLDCGDNREGVAQGLAATARVITSAALIMIAAFTAFILGADPIVKTLGLGLAVAVFLDATLIRMLLVPASMTLMGRANWWLPRHLDRILPRLHDSVERIGDKLPLRPPGRHSSSVPVLAVRPASEVSPPQH